MDTSRTQPTDMFSLRRSQIPWAEAKYRWQNMDFDIWSPPTVSLHCVLSLPPSRASIPLLLPPRPCTAASTTTRHPSPPPLRSRPSALPSPTAQPGRGRRTASFPVVAPSPHTQHLPYCPPCHRRWVPRRATRATVDGVLRHASAPPRQRVRGAGARSSLPLVLLLGVAPKICEGPCRGA